MIRQFWDPFIEENHWTWFFILRLYDWLYWNLTTTNIGGNNLHWWTFFTVMVCALWKYQNMIAFDEKSDLGTILHNIVDSFFFFWCHLCNLYYQLKFLFWKPKERITHCLETSSWEFLKLNIEGSIRLKDWTLQVSHIYWEANFCTDLLENLVLHGSFDWTIMDSPPSSFSLKLHFGVLGVPLNLFLNFFPLLLSKLLEK